MAIEKLQLFVNIRVVWNLTNNKPVDPNEKRTFDELKIADALARPPTPPDTPKQQRRKVIADRLRTGTINLKTVSEYIRNELDIEEPTG